MTFTEPLKNMLLSLNLNHAKYLDPSSGRIRSFEIRAAWSIVKDGKPPARGSLFEIEGVTGLVESSGMTQDSEVISTMTLWVEVP